MGNGSARQHASKRKLKPMELLRAITSISRAIFPLFAAAFGFILLLHGPHTDNLTECGVGIILLWLFIDHKPEVTRHD